MIVGPLSLESRIKQGIGSRPELEDLSQSMAEDDSLPGQNGLALAHTMMLTSYVAECGNLS